MMKKVNKKGFTLAELLIVVAIIAVLVTISIPIFTSQLEKSREAVDLANIRSAYAECSAEALTADTATTYAVQKAVDIKQTTSGWASDFDEVCGVKKASVPQVKTTEKIYVTVYCDGKAATLTKASDGITAAPSGSTATVKTIQ